MEQTRKVQYWVTFAVALATMTTSMAFSWTTPVIPKFHNNETDISLTDNEISWLVSAISPGTILGCLLSRYPTDRFGRRATLLGSAFPFIIGTIFVITATEAWMLCFARFCWGFGSGFIAPVAMIYTTEIAAKEIRGSLSIINRFMFTFGGFLMLVTGSIVSYQVLSYMLIFLAVLFFGACWWIPETPYFLLKEGKIDAAKKALIQLNGYKDEKILEEKLVQMRSHVREDMQRSGTFKELLTGKQYRKALVISMGLRGTQVLSGSIPLQQYLGRILQETNSDISVSTGLILFGAVRFITSMLASVIVDKLGRRPLLIYSYMGSSLILCSLGVFFFFDEVMNRTPNYLGYITLTGLILFSTVSTLGFDTVNYVIPAEIFPLNVKSTAMTLLILFVSLVVFFAVRGYQILKDFSGLYGVFWFFASFSLAGAIFSYTVVPETKGKGLREIQIELQGDLYEEASVKLKKSIENTSGETRERVEELTRLKA